MFMLYLSISTSLGCQVSCIALAHLYSFQTPPPRSINFSVRGLFFGGKVDLNPAGAIHVSHAFA